MSRLFQLFLAFLLGLFGLGRKRVRGPSRERPKRVAQRPPKRPPAREPKRKRGGRSAPPLAADAPRATRARRRKSPEALAEALADALPRIDHRGPGAWEPAENVGVEEGRVTIDLHGLSDEDAVALVEEALGIVGDAGGAPVRLVTGHGRDRAAGYSLIRVALVEALGERDDITVEDLARHRRHRESDDRLGHMDLLVG